jgi:hypothetical protein
MDFNVSKGRGANNVESARVICGYGTSPVDERSPSNGCTKGSDCWRLLSDNGQPHLQEGYLLVIERVNSSRRGIRSAKKVSEC